MVSTLSPVVGIVSRVVPWLSLTNLLRMLVFPASAGPTNSTSTQSGLFRGMGKQAPISHKFVVVVVVVVSQRTYSLFM